VADAIVLLLLECGPSNNRTLECLIEKRRRVFAAPRHPIWMIELKAGLARRMTPIVARGSCRENNVLTPQIQPAFGPSERIIRSA
jgi:hypothetical protein